MPATRKERWNAKRNTALRYITFATTCLCMLTSGSLYTFSVLSQSFTAKLGYSSADLNIIGGVGNTALFVSVLATGPLYDYTGPRWTQLFSAITSSLGFFLMYLAFIGKISSSVAAVSVYYFIAGTGAAAIYMAGIGVTVTNFSPRQSGKVIGVLLLFYGLSATIYSQVYSHFYANDTASYLLFLTISVGAINLLSCLAIFKVPYTTERRAPLPPPMSSMEGIISSLQEPEDKEMPVEDTEEPPPPPPQQPTRHVVFSTPSPHPPPEEEADIADGTAGPSNNNAMRIDTSLSAKVEYDDAITPTTCTEDIPIEYSGMTPLEILKSPTFWFFALTLVFQQGNTYITDISQIADSSTGRDPSNMLTSEQLASKTALHVTLFSVFQSLGRLFFGIASDSVVVAATKATLPDRPKPKYFAIPKVFYDPTWLMMAAQSLLIVPTLLLAFGEDASGVMTDAKLVLSSILVGFGFGAAGACFPGLTRDFFGVRYYGTACGFVLATIPVGLLLSNYIFGKIYDGKISQEQEGITTAGVTNGRCLGTSCYSFSYVIFALLQLVSMMFCALLMVLRGVQNRRKQQNAAHSMQQPAFH